VKREKLGETPRKKQSLERRKSGRGARRSEVFRRRDLKGGDGEYWVWARVASEGALEGGKGSGGGSAASFE